MYRNRKGHIYRKIIRKCFALIVLLIGIRLVWVSVTSAWTSGKERDNAAEVRNVVKFVGGEQDGGSFKFSEIKGKITKVGANKLGANGRDITDNSRTKDVNQDLKKWEKVTVLTTSIKHEPAKLVTANRKSQGTTTVRSAEKQSLQKVNDTQKQNNKPTLAKHGKPTQAYQDKITTEKVKVANESKTNNKKEIILNYDSRDNLKLNKSHEEKSNINGKLHEEKSHVNGKLRDEKSHINGNLRDEKSHINGKLRNEKSQINGKLRDEKSHINGKLRDEKSHINGNLRDEKSHINGKLRNEKSQINGKLRDEKSHVNGKLRDEKSHINGNLRDEKSHINGKLRNEKSHINGKLRDEKSQINEKLRNEKSKNTNAKTASNVQRTDSDNDYMHVTTEMKNKCKIVESWGQKYNADISTYDLFKNVSYRMDSNGQYPIPVRTIEEIKKSDKLKHLTVVLVPFSHADPGYGLTIEQYYDQMTRDTLNNMVVKLAQYPNMTFQWAETVFLARWFEDLNAVGKEKVKKLIQNGQLEIVLGGWVMPDEASTNYVAVVDQLIEGHQWLLENLGVKPKSAWVNDPFGYSSTMPYFWKSSGMDNLLFLRINQPVKAKLMERKSLEFMWRPYWKTSDESDVLSSLMSYTNYWVSDVCGPEQINCQEFNFLHLWEGGSKAVEVTDSNVADQARKLSDQFRITGDLYKYNTLYIGLGEDFSYPKAHQWDNMYKNYEKLINFINSQKTWNMTIKFGTLTEYFTRLRSDERKMSESSENSRSTTSTFPTLSGDFFPYTERNQEFWTGYFTTRPMNKRFSRELESLIRAADIFDVVVYSLFKYYGVKFTAYDAVAEGLRTARRELGMFMHHDGITGTSLPHVVQDYEERLFKAHERAQAAFKMAIMSLLSKGKEHNPKLLQEEIVKPGTKQMSGNVVIDTNKETTLILINSIARRRKEVVNIFTNSKEIEITSPSKTSLPYQVTIRKENRDTPFIISFETELPALGIEQYSLQPKHRGAERMEIYERLPSESESVITIENTYMKVEFEKDSGTLKRIVHYNGHVTNITAQFMVYQSKTSGAYIFGPAGPAQAFMAGSKTVKVTKGQLFSEVKVTSLGFLISVKLYNTSGVQGQGIHVRTEVEMPAVNMKEMEVILRFKSDVQNGDHFYTDQNGFQLIGRENNPAEKIESNYYPVTTMAILEDNVKRFTLHCKQPHGGASLKPGQFEVMIDRHTLRDDKRGLGQGVYDNVRVNSDFIIHIEHKAHSFKPEEERYTYPSEDSILMNDVLQNNIFKYIQQDTSLTLLKKVHPLKSTEFPCDVSIVGLRNIVNNNLAYNATSLVLHRKPLHCGFTPLNRQCSDNNRSLTIKNLFPKLKVKISETSLSHLHNKKLLNGNSDITPDVHELRAFKIHF